MGWMQNSNDGPEYGCSLNGAGVRRISRSATMNFGKLNWLLKRIKSNNITVLMGDVNVKIEYGIELVGENMVNTWRVRND